MTALRAIDFGVLPWTVIGSLVIAVALLAIRIFVMQRVQSRRQRENRQETERLKSLVGAYRAMAGSFSPAEPGDREQLEGGLSDVILFGSLRQVEFASECARALTRGDPVNYQPLLEDLRASLRDTLGLEPIPDTVDIPPSGPAPPRRGDGQGGERRGGGRGGGGGSMGGDGTIAGLGVGAGAGLGAGSAGSDDPR
jgi:hypothetical protein